MTAARMVVTDPETGETVGTVPRLTARDALSALDRADGARAEIAALPTRTRMAALSSVATKLEEAAESVATLIAREGVKTINEARSEVARAVETLRLSAEAARRLSGETIRFDQYPSGIGRTGWSEPVPIGVVLGITPFNDPLNLVAHKVGPAIAAGCPILLKPHAETPLSANWLVNRLADQLPDGAVQILTGHGSEIVPPLLADDRVRLVSFTGGLETGRRIAAAAGLTRLVMELGSNCATIVMDDADISRAAEACVSGAVAAAGQNCLHVQRIIAHRAVMSDLRERLADGFRSTIVGPKRDERSQMGCLIDEKSARRVHATARHAIESGARLLAGGTRDGVAVAPTLLEHVDAADPLLKDEVFGPITVLIAVDNLDEAIDVANATPFGLQAGLFTQRLEHAQKAIRTLDVGAVIVNDSTDYRLDAMPFGGTGHSGIGREGVGAAIATMTEPKVACFRWPSSMTGI